MKKINTYNQILGLSKLNNKIIAFSKINHSGDEILFIETKTLYFIFKNSPLLFYQKEKFNSLYIINHNTNFKEIELEGEFILSGSILTNNSIIIPNKVTKTFFKINLIKNEKTDLNYYATFTGSVNNFFFQIDTKVLTFYYAISGKKVWERDLTINDEINFLLQTKLNVEFFGNETLIFIPFKDGTLAALEINNGKQRWLNKELLIIRPTIFQDKIYGIGNGYIAELDVNTGELNRNLNMLPIIEKYEFYPTGYLEVYEDYLFSFMPEGRIAMFDRKTFELREMIEVEGLITNARGQIIWHNQQLYVLTFPETLHVFGEASELV